VRRGKGKEKKSVVLCSTEKKANREKKREVEGER
jgi:gluconate kinase